MGTTSNDDTSGISIIDNVSKENSKKTTVTTDVDTQPDTKNHNSISSTKDGTAVTTTKSTKDNKEAATTTTTTTDVDTKPNDTTANSTPVTMDNTDKEGSKSDSNEDKEDQAVNASTNNNTTVEYCTQLCEGQKENKKYKQVLVNGNEFRQAVREWSSNPESSPY